MKLIAAKCTQCGSNINIDPTKEAGICPHCQTPFITQKAVNNYNSYVTNTNDYSGATINVYGNPLMLEKHLQNARRAKSKEDWEEVEKYYNYAEECDPTNIEAIFYSSFAKAKMSLRDTDMFKRKDTFDVLFKSISIIDDNFKMEEKDAQKELIIQISKDLISMTQGSYLYNNKKNGYGIVTWTDKGETETLFRMSLGAFMDSVRNIIKIYGENNPETKYLYLIIIDCCSYILSMGVGNKEYFQSMYLECHRRVKEFDPNHIVPEYAPKGTYAQRSGKTIVGVIFAIIFIIVSIIIYLI